MNDFNSRVVLKELVSFAVCEASFTDTLSVYVSYHSCTTMTRRLQLGPMRYQTPQQAAQVRRKLIFCPQFLQPSQQRDDVAFARARISKRLGLMLFICFHEWWAAQSSGAAGRWKRPHELHDLLWRGGLSRRISQAIERSPWDVRKHNPYGTFNLYYLYHITKNQASQSTN